MSECVGHISGGDGVRWVCLRMMVVVVVEMMVMMMVVIIVVQVMLVVVGVMVVVGSCLGGDYPRVILVMCAYADPPHRLLVWSAAGHTDAQHSADTEDALTRFFTRNGGGGTMVVCVCVCV